MCVCMFIVNVCSRAAHYFGTHFLPDKQFTSFSIAESAEMKMFIVIDFAYKEYECS